ncbi:DUF2269 family protein [Candidatus Pacearchaeota archaeon]|nr:DUF2269 family protein [Candidatus Pacearchaeota archaeon]
MAWLEIFSLLHFIGLAWGLGGATAAAIISAKAEKNPEISPAVMKIIPAMSELIWLGLILLILSGIGMSFLIEWPVNKQMLLVKHVLVAWIVIIGVIIGINAKRMHALAPKPKEKPSAQFLAAKKLLKAFSIINLILWYVVAVMSAFL